MSKDTNDKHTVDMVASSYRVNFTHVLPSGLLRNGTLVVAATTSALAEQSALIKLAPKYNGVRVGKITIY